MGNGREPDIHNKKMVERGETMNLSKLFQMQKELDDYIVKTKGLEGQDLLPQKILALQVELGECANEWRGFKFWSNKQFSHTGNYKQCLTCNGRGQVTHTRENGMWSESCKECNGDGHVLYNPLLEEYIDCLHFILSIGNAIITNPKFDHDDDFEYLHENNIHIFTKDTPLEQFAEIFNSISEFRVNNDLEIYQDVFLYMIGLSVLLGFTWEQIEQAYTDKWNINKQRQENGY
jgi:dimeric dUTPase (all-alpha-NTP-PPase superfamily)